MFFTIWPLRDEIEILSIVRITRRTDKERIKKLYFETREGTAIFVNFQMFLRKFMSTVPLLREELEFRLELEGEK